MDIFLISDTVIWMVWMLVVVDHQALRLLGASSDFQQSETMNLARTNHGTKTWKQKTSVTVQMNTFCLGLGDLISVELRQRCWNCPQVNMSHTILQPSR